MSNSQDAYTAFEGGRCLAMGRLKDVAIVAKCALDAQTNIDNRAPILIFQDATSEAVELDWRGTESQFLARLELLLQSPDETPKPEITLDVLTERGPGRPRLGVVAREITLLPRHWEWLAAQTGGASVALRKLVEVARRDSEVKDRVRKASEVGYKFMSTMAGHEKGFEEASRALFSGNQAAFEGLIADWPVDVQFHLKRILAEAFQAQIKELI